MPWLLTVPNQAMTLYPEPIYIFFSLAEGDQGKVAQRLGLLKTAVFNVVHCTPEVTLVCH